MTRLHINGLAIRRSYFLAYLNSGNPRSLNIVLNDRQILRCTARPVQVMACAGSAVAPMSESVEATLDKVVDYYFCWLLLFACVECS